MIDDKTILQWELDAEEAGLTQHAEIIRNARRYLALRDHGVIADLKQDAEWLFAGQLDAAADRLMEGGE